ncbi:hypothetical protein [Emticicia fontis]
MTAEEIAALQKELADAKAEKEQADKVAETLAEQLKVATEKATAATQTTKTLTVDKTKYKIVYPEVQVEGTIYTAEKISELKSTDEKQAELIKHLIDAQVLIETK